jgi:hypothetical protein
MAHIITPAISTSFLLAALPPDVSEEGNKAERKTAFTEKAYGPDDGR